MSRQQAGLAVVVVGAVCFFFIAGLWDTVQAKPANEEKDVQLHVGDTAPDIALPVFDPATGAMGTRKLSDFRGKKNVVLAFYPKAFTPECTKQMCGYRDSIRAFNESDTEVIAISLDTPEKSVDFQRRYNLPFPVVADPDRVIVRAYGVPIVNLWVIQFAKRSVFLIDKEGVLRYINPHYHVKKDAAILQTEIAKLNAAAK